MTPGDSVHTDAEPLRLQVVLARAGIASRRAAAEIITAGRVQVNGVAVRDPAHKVGPGTDLVLLDGTPLPQPESPRYFMLHKPRGVLSAAADSRGRPVVTQALPPDTGRCVPVGRLDLDTEGLLLLTNDGPLIDRLLHPRNALPREYLVEVQGRPNSTALQRMYDGVRLADGVVLRAKPDRSKRAGSPAAAQQPGTSWLVLTLHEGRKHAVRDLCAAVGHPVVRLIRVKFGPLRLRNQPLGAIRPLTDREIRLLTRAAGTP